MPQYAIGAPLFRQFDHRAREIAVELFELGFKAREERESVGRGTGESGHDPVVVKAAELARRGFQHFLAERDLAVAGHDHLAAFADTQNCC